MITSCGLLGSRSFAVPSAWNWTIWFSDSQLVIRWFRPWAVGPLLFPGFVGIVSPTETGQTAVDPAISSE